MGVGAESGAERAQLGRAAAGDAVSSWLDRLAALLSLERERWVLWLPVAVGAGDALYFSLASEPPAWLGPLLLLAASAAAYILRRNLPWLIAAVGATAMAGGFAIAAARTEIVAAPIWQRTAATVMLEGRIAAVEPLERGERLVLDRLQLRQRDSGPIPERVRVRLPANSGADLPPGQRVLLRAVLMPPPPAVAPGAYDFSRQAWFQGIGAVGFAIGRPQALASPAADGWLDALRIGLAQLRHGLTLRITRSIDQAGLGPGVGAVAADLVTGERGPVPPSILQAYRDAGLAHILVIAGMHMSMVAGLAFVVLRGLLAAIPGIALRHDIKKWAAAVALLVTLGYLVISGAPVPTQRAFVMNGIVLLAVLLDREAISLRSISWAALVVLLLEPEALVGPSFQMSFAAVCALISAYEALAPRLMAWRRADGGWWVWPSAYVGGILLTTLIAGSATAFFTVYHFNRYATFSLLGNLLAVPIVGFWVMPAMLLALVLLPFGLDGFGWWLMGEGIAVVDRVAQTVSTLPGAAIDMPAMPISALILFALGGLWLCLWRRRWRLLGLAGMAAALLVYALHRPPDLLIDGSGRLAAVRAADGRLLFPPQGGGKELRETWAKLAGQGQATPAWSEADGVRCDALGCIWTPPGHVVSLARLPEALGEDCATADVVAIPVPVYAACPSARLFIDGMALRRGGTQAIWLDGEEVRVETVADWQGDRPWSHRGGTGGRARPQPSRDVAAHPPQDERPEAGEETPSSDAEAPLDGPEP